MSNSISSKSRITLPTWMIEYKQNGIVTSDVAISLRQDILNGTKDEDNVKENLELLRKTHIKKMLDEEKKKYSFSEKKRHRSTNKEKDNSDNSDISDVYDDEDDSDDTDYSEHSSKKKRRIKPPKLQSAKIKPLFQLGDRVYITEKSNLHKTLVGIEGVIIRIGTYKDTWITVSFANTEHKVRSPEIIHMN
jgi:hypothetical protein